MRIHLPVSMSERNDMACSRHGVKLLSLLVPMARALSAERHTEATAQLQWISVFKTGEQDVLWLRGARLLTITLSTSEQTLESIAGEDYSSRIGSQKLCDRSVQLMGIG